MASNVILNYATERAKENPHEYLICCVLIRGGSIIRHRFNTAQVCGYRADVFNHQPTMHAEIAVLHNMPKDVLSGCSLLVVRVNRKHELTSAKPCLGCFKAIQKSGITKLEFSNYAGEIEKINPSLINISEWTKEISPQRIIAKEI